jgi:hypothetical protein
MAAQGIITPKEAETSRSLLKENPTGAELAKAKGGLKFHVIRWSPWQILDGKQTLRDGRVYTMAQAVLDPIIAKLDAIALVQRSRFTDFSVIYEFRNRNTTLNPDPYGDIVQSIKENMLYYQAIGHHFKVLKRRFIIARITGDADRAARLNDVLNSDLGRVYAISGDLGTLVNLLRDFERIPKDVVDFELDQFRGRLSGVYALPSMIAGEHKTIAQIDQALATKSKSEAADILEKVKERLECHLNSEALKVDIDTPVAARGLNGGLVALIFGVPLALGVFLL